jgi:predicted nucleotidyltransferase
VRLAPETIPPLLRAVHENFGASANVWLFGSRTDNTKRGGDIDLYIETDFDQDIVARRSSLLQQLTNVFGEQKIDLAVRPRNRPPHPLHIIAIQHGILLSEPR